MNCLQNDQGGITYAAPQRIGQPDQRTHALNDVRVIVDAAQELKRHLQHLQAAVRAAWPKDYPVPPEVIVIDCAATRVSIFADYAIQRARGGALKNLGEKAEG